MSDRNSFAHQLQVSFMSDNDETYASLERVTGCARRSGVELMSLRITRRELQSHAWLRVGSDSRDAIELLANRLCMVIGLDDLICNTEEVQTQG
jgi:acetolactate synthase regulatory subunit